MIKTLLLCSAPTPYKNPLFEQIAKRPEIDLFVCFCVWKSGTRPWSLGELEGVRYEVLKGWHIPKGKGNYIRINWSILARLWKEEPDVVVVAGYNHPTMLMAILYCAVTHTPFVIQGETWTARAGWKSALKKRLLHPLLFRARSFLVTGRLARRYWQSQGYSEERMRVFANTPDVEYFEKEKAKVDEEEIAALRSSWGCDGRRIAVFVGRLINVKAVDLLIEALRQLDDRERPFLLVIGDGVQRTELEKAAEGLPVKFGGFLQMEELAAVYAAADFFVLPSRVEPWGVVVNEAMACGLPVLLSDQIGAHADLLDQSDEGNGVLAIGPSVETLRDGLRKLTTASDAELARMSNSSQRIIQDWKYEASVSNFVKACEEDSEVP